MQQPRAPLRDVLPYLALKFERLPAVRRKPAVGARQSELRIRAHITAALREGSISVRFSLTPAVISCFSGSQRAQLRADVRPGRKGCLSIAHERLAALGCPSAPRSS